MLFDHPTPFFFVLLFALSVFVEIEHRAGMRLSVDTDSLRHEQLVAARDAIGLLLILLLGFTLARAIARLTSASDFSSTRRTPSARLRGALVRFPNRSTQKCSDCLANMLTRVRASLLRAWRGKTWSSPSSQRNTFRTSCGSKPFSWQKPHQPRSPLLLFSRLTRPST